ncbi:PAS domain-containing protein [Haloglomus litoreum]|uniref:PAS domain-containing protein n=1 Tax=Haloglomus litoreum TaxID=3034026 RepID=UPI0023E84B45|nr:PAS domain-containing protein [Haloglomus sp. DT116]
MELGGSVALRVLDQFPLNVAILDDDGVIQWVNEAWREYGTRNDLNYDDHGVGQPYLPEQRGAHDLFASHAYDGVTAVVEGDRPSFSMEYPCHGPDELRWFRMYVAGVELEGRRYCVVSHENITDEKLAALMTEAHRERAATLTRVLLHDMRNAVGIADGWLTELFPDPAERERLEPVLRALARIQETVDDSRDLLELSGQPPAYEKVAVDDLARAAWDGIEHEDASLALVDEFPVLCYREEAELLLSSLFRNAVGAGAAEVSVRLGDREFYVDDDRPAPLPEPPGEAFEEPSIGPDGRMLFEMSLVSPLAVVHGWTTSLSHSPAGGWRFTVRTEQLHV